MERFACRICGNRDGNRSYIAREMMFGFRDEFEYVQCAACECLQMREVPVDLGRYYPSDGYSAHQPQALVADTPVKALLRHHRAAYSLYGRDLFGAALCRIFGVPAFYPSYCHQLRKLGARLDDRILDVGSGTGAMLINLQTMGFRNLVGVDPFVAEEIRYENGVRILKQELAETEGQFDLITLHHSFEHMPEPAEVFRHLHRLLTPGRQLLLRIPVVPCYAWSHYGTDWVQLDAPRHLFIHSPRSIRLMAEQVGLEVAGVEYDSTEMQFGGSERYRRDVPLLADEAPVPDEQRALYREKARELNARGEGDQACFYLRKPRVA